MEETTIKRRSQMKGDDGGGFIWFLGAVGAAVYYIQNADTFVQGVTGILKALIWPAIVVYHLLQSFGV